MKFISHFVRTDVTTVQLFQDDYILAGVGHALYIYQISKNCLISKQNIFEGQRIHGFKVNGNNVAIFGGKQIRIVNINISNLEGKADQNLYHVGNVLDKNFKLQDWIISLTWIENGTKLSVLLAHNIIQICNLQLSCVGNDAYGCEEKCILYCGSLLEVDGRVVALSGTAFSQIVIWSTESDRVYHRLTGHKGVIFSVSYNKDKNIMISTSDDRSVRIWSIENESSNAETLQYWKECYISLKTTLFGHTARIMQHKSFGDYVISIGEDSLMCLWNLQGDLISKRKVSQSGVLWCLDCDKKIVAIGGGDSGITVLPLVLDENISTTKILEFSDKNLIAKRIVLTARGNIACITEQGKLMYHNMLYNSWQEVYSVPSTKSYLCVSQCKQFLAVGSINGNIEIFLEPCKNIATLSHYGSFQSPNQRKILSLHWVYDRHLVMCDESGHISVFGPGGLIEKMNFDVPKSKQRWLTAAALEPNRKQVLLVGDRCGNLHVFKKGNINAAQSVNKLHGNIGINLINFCGDKVMTAGRDGLIKVMILNSSNILPQMHFMYSGKLPFDWIEKFVNRDISLICGFKETNFIVWNMKHNISIVNINCGGGHRSWDLMKNWFKLSHNHSENILRFVYVKNSHVVLVDTKFENIAPKIISNYYHSKEINCCKTLPVLMPESKTYFFISAGEDTVINCSSSNMDKCLEMNNVFDIHSHLSSVRCMCLVKHNQMRDTSEFFLYSGGGRAQICVTKLEISNDSNEVNCYEVASYMYKGTDLERKRKDGSWSKVQMDTDVETRFMKIALISNIQIDIEEYFHYLLTGCSDGFLRIYKVMYSPNNKCDFALESTIDYHKKCILNVHSFEMFQMLIGLSMTVDGTVAFWNLSCYSKVLQIESFKNIPLFTKQFHTAGINAFDLIKFNDNTVALATGGDDNLFKLTILQFTKINDIISADVLGEWSCQSFHCSQITGIAFCSKNIIIITSIDQRVTVVRWSFKDVVDCQHLSQYCSSIPDVQGLQVVEDNGNIIQLCVFGKGMEILELDLS